MKTGKVLSLSGGGTWSLIETKALMSLYPNMSGNQILDQFDIAIANSGGSIVLAGLAADMTPEEIYALYLDQSVINQLYTKTSGFESIFSSFGMAPRWSAAGKLATLQKILKTVGAAPLDSIKAKIAICAYDLDRNIETVFRSYQTPLDLTSTPFVPTLAEAAHASSSAPVIYFDGPAIVANQKNKDDVRRFWDGGLGSYNLPARAGLAEAHALGFTTVQILSLATGVVWRPIGTKIPLYAPPGNSSVLGALKCLSQDCVVSPAISALMDTMVCPGTTLIHLSPYIRPDGGPGTWAAPKAMLDVLGTDAWTRLVSFDMDLTHADDIDLLSRFTDAWIAGIIPNAPIIANPMTGSKQYGCETFAEGVALWKKSQCNT